MEEVIYSYLLKKCVGYENRIKGKALMNLFDIKDHKTFRSHIQFIRENPAYNRLIGSEAGKQGGYWIIANKEEFDRTVHHLYLRAKEMERTSKIMNKKGKNKERGF